MDAITTGCFGRHLRLAVVASAGFFHQAEVDMSVLEELADSTAYRGAYPQRRTCIRGRIGVGLWLEHPGEHVGPHHSITCPPAQ